MQDQHEYCVACGFDGAGYDSESLVAALDSLGTWWRVLISDAGRDLRVRPEPGRWSAIEYAAHSRDVTALHVFGVEQALTTDEPAFPAIEGDALIESAAVSYGEADPDQIVAELDANATQLARLAYDAGAAAWTRGLTIGASRMDVRRLLEHALHDSTHHLQDVEHGLEAIRGQTRPRAADTDPARHRGPRSA